jgi:para-aminobenzoate synthetase
MRTLLVDNYDSYTYNLYQLIAEVTGVEPVVVLNDQVDADELDDILGRDRSDRSDRSDHIECIVVSPGPGTPECAEDAGISSLVFSRYTDVPIFGVCFGFQCLCRVHGGAGIVRAPEPVHGRTSAVRHGGEDPLFSGIPSGEDFQVVRYHSLCVDPGTLDEKVVAPLAWAADDGAGAAGEGRGPARPGLTSPLLMAARHRLYPHWGVQFHPESVCTQHGRRLLENVRDMARAWNEARGRVGRCSKRWLDQSLGAPDVLPLAATKPVVSLERRMVITYEKIDACLGGIPGGTARMVDELFVHGAAGEPGCTRDVFFLDSATRDRTRFSYMGGMGGSLWRRISYALDETGAGGLLTSWDRQGRSCVEERASVFDWISEQAAWADTFDEARTSLPFEFLGGAVGYLGYELKCQTGGRMVHRSPNCDACFFLVDRFVCVDHHSDDVYVVALHDAAEAAEQRASEAWVHEVAGACRRMHGSRRDEMCPFRDSAASVAHNGASCSRQFADECTERHSQHEYVAKVKRCREFLYAGDSYELCMTNMMTSPRARASDTSPWQYYKNLRRSNPAPYAAYLDFSAISSGKAWEDDPGSSGRGVRVGHGTHADTGCTSQTTGGRRVPQGPIVCCSSPERFLRGSPCGDLEAKPIKGTARRDPEDVHRDAEAARALLASEKNRAENLMIVDLLRNDLGRVSETGTVRVPGLMRLESFATVHQMVSTIVGRRKPSIGVGEAIRAAFPGGSMTGAPKIRSMEILDDLEDGPRGVYSGSIGYVSWNGAFDLNIVIRTAVFNNDEILAGAGGAVVVQSDPLEEYEEMRLKFDTLRVT